MKRALIVKTSSLGDIIHAFPVAQYLKERPEMWEIDWIVEEQHAPLVEAFPPVDRVITVDTKAWRRGIALDKAKAFHKQITRSVYDVVFDLQGNVKSGLLSWWAKAPAKVGFSKASVPEWPNTLFTNSRFTIPAGQNIRQDNLSLVQQYFKDNRAYRVQPLLLSITDEGKNHVSQLISPHPQIKIMVCPGAAWPNKQLPLERLKQHLNTLKQAHFFLVWGTQQEKRLVEMLYQEYPGRSTIIDKLSLPVLQHLMNEMDLVIAVDSLPLHLAGMTTAKTFGFFGPSSLKKYLPLGEDHQGVQGSCPYGRTFEKRCPVLRTCPTGACMDEVREAISCRTPD